MGWLLDIYLLENLSIISILKFFTIGILHSKEDNLYGLIVAIHKLELRLTFGLLEIPKLEKGVSADA